MQKKQIRIIRKNLVENAPKAFSYFKRPLNIILIVILAVGITSTALANEIDPATVYKDIYTRSYQVTTNITYVSGINIFPNETTHLSFIMPSNSSLHYYLYGLVPEKTNNPAYPGGVRVVNMPFSFGNASDGTNVTVSEPSLPFPVNASMIIYSLSNNNFTLTVNAFSQSGFILNFYPPLAIFGLALSTVSMILIATISGVKGEEV